MLFPRIFSLALLLLSSLADAHPAGGKPASHRMRVQVLQDQLALGYLAEFPNRLLSQYKNETSSSDLELFEQLHGELSEGIIAQFNGSSLTLESTPFQPENVRQNPRSSAIEIHFTGNPPSEEGRLKIMNRNLPEHHAFFYTELSVEDPISIQSSSLIARSEDGEELDFNGRWSVLESHRDLILSVSDWRVHEKRGSLRTGDAVLPPQRRWTTRIQIFGLLAAAGLLLTLWRRRSQRSQTFE